MIVIHCHSTPSGHHYYGDGRVQRHDWEARLLRGAAQHVSRHQEEREEQGDRHDDPDGADGHDEEHGDHHDDHDRGDGDGKEKGRQHQHDDGERCQK